MLRVVRELIRWADPHRERVRWALFAITAVCIAALLPRQGITTMTIEVGRRWQAPDLVAPFDFALQKDAATLARERQAAAAGVPDIFLADSVATLRAERGLSALYTQLAASAPVYAQALRRGPDSAAAVITALMPRLDPAAERGMLHRLLTEPALRSRLRARTDKLVAGAYAVGYVDRALSRSRLPYLALRPNPATETVVDLARVVDADAMNALLAEAARDLPADEAKLLTEWIRTHLRPNYHYSQERVEADREAAQRAVSEWTGLVTQGQLIVAKDQRITPEIQQQLNSLAVERQRREGVESIGLTFLGQLALVSLLLMMTAIFLRNNRRDIWGRNRKVALLLFTFLFMAALNAFVIWLGEAIGLRISPTYVVPMSMAPIMLTVFFDDRVGFFANIIIALLAGLILYNSFEYFFVQVVAGSVAVSGLTILRRRSQIFITAGSLLLAYWGAYLAYNLTLRGGFADINYGNLVLFALNVLITLGAYQLIYFFERVFGVTSDLTYLELLDTDHPLLKELSLKAPGTYQHSLQVANIAEHVATQIGANALQVRVGALFHDIGKVYQPDFFIENQKHGYNPHERIDAHLSAEIIMNHVDYGVERAHAHNMPTEVVDFIRTHHGTSRVEHFYRTYVRTHPEEVAAEADFRYKGPRPWTKEQAILMLADACEAASRSLKQPSADALKHMTNAVISHKITDGQLDDARISFRDVAMIRAEIYTILGTIYHSRLTDGAPPVPLTAARQAPPLAELRGQVRTFMQTADSNDPIRASEASDA